MTDGRLALPTSFATCAAVRWLVRLKPIGAATMTFEQSCRKLRRDTPLFLRCVAIVCFSPVDIDSLPGFVAISDSSTRFREEEPPNGVPLFPLPRLRFWRFR